MHFEAGRAFRDELRREASTLESRLGVIRRMLADLDQFLGEDTHQEIGGPPADQPQERERTPEATHGPTANGSYAVTPAQATATEPERSWTRYDKIAVILAMFGPISTKDVVSRLIAEFNDIRPDTNRSKFYNVVNSALRAGESKGLYQRDQVTSTWSLTHDGRELADKLLDGEAADMNSIGDH